ncbi:MAG: hypothetical protein ABSE73_27410 [Planctomycetota bacterium]
MLRQDGVSLLPTPAKLRSSVGASGLRGHPETLTGLLGQGGDQAGHILAEATTQPHHSIRCRLAGHGRPDRGVPRDAGVVCPERRGGQRVLPVAEALGEHFGDAIQPIRHHKVEVFSALRVLKVKVAQRALVGRAPPVIREPGQQIGTLTVEEFASRWLWPRRKCSAPRAARRRVRSARAPGHNRTPG